jgi:alpha-glucosidase
VKAVLLSRTVILLVANSLASADGTAADVALQSPNGQIRTEISVNTAGRLQYQVWRAGIRLLEPSPLGITLDGADLGQGVTLGEPQGSQEQSYYSWRGAHSTATNSYLSLVIPVTNAPAHTSYSIEFRAFDTGVAFRYAIPGKGQRTISGERSAFVVPAESLVWIQTNISNYEGLYELRRPEEIPHSTDIGMPMTVVLPGGGGYLALSEAALFGYSGMTLRPNQDTPDEFDAAFRDDQQWPMTAPFKTPWRVILISADLNGLVNSDVIPSLCPPPGTDLEHAPWIRPGRAVWSWWSEGTGDVERNKHYVDYAQQLGFEYNLVDAGWEDWHQAGKGKWELLHELVDYGRAHGVAIWVWKHYRGVQQREARRQFLEACHQAGVVGVKIDFMDSESKDMIDFYERTLRDAAEFQLMINFHGANKPTGESRTWPNEMTREGIRGLEYNKWSALPATHYATLPFTRYLAGHGDFTVCTLRPNFLKGTRAGLQLATSIVFTSPLMHWADTPSLYLHSTTVDLIRSIPSLWDETRILPGSDIGKLAAFARRAGDTWFVGIINAGPAREYPLKLDFLGPRDHDAWVASDHPDRAEELVFSKAHYRGDETLNLNLMPQGGWLGRFTLRN